MQLKCSILVLMALGDTRENDSFDKWSIFNQNLFKFLLSTRALQHYNQQQQPSEKRETEREREQALP